MSEAFVSRARRMPGLPEGAAQDLRSDPGAVVTASQPVPHAIYQLPRSGGRQAPGAIRGGKEQGAALIPERI